MPLEQCDGAVWAAVYRIGLTNKIEKKEKVLKSDNTLIAKGINSPVHRLDHGYFQHELGVRVVLVHKGAGQWPAVR